MKGRPKKLTAHETALVQALAAKGYHKRSIAALFDVSVSVIYSAMHETVQPLETGVLPKFQGFPLTWAQRVIWSM